MTCPEYISNILSVLKNSGYEAYVVGGGVRDAILGSMPNDFDIATSAPPDKMLELFSDFKLITTGLKHGTVTVIIDHHPVEVTTFRIDGDYEDGRHPKDVCFTNSLLTDLSRRDFTINAMAYDDTQGIIDPFGGISDLRIGVVRAVGYPERRFTEDALRIMRAFRFSAQLGFEIEVNTLSAAKALKDTLRNVSRERISTEFIKLITSPDPYYALSSMKVCGVLGFVLGDHIPPDEHLKALTNAPNSPRARLGILLCTLDRQKRSDVLSSLKLSNKLTSNVLTIANMLSSRLSGDEVEARRFIGTCGELTEDTLNCAKSIGGINADFESLVRQNLKRSICTSYKDLAINGKDLIEIGVRGKDIGKILDALFEEVIKEPSNNNRERLLTLAKKHLK